MIEHTITSSQTTNSPKQRIIRDKAFAKRLEIACDGHPHCPTDQYRGKQKWIYENLESEFGIKVSAEAVRKWFAGESRPRPKAMSAIARLLEVDEAWLSLGITPDLTPREQRKRNAVADGAVNLVAGMIQMGGGHISFPEDDSAHILAIIGGKSVQIDVVLPIQLDRDHSRLTILSPIEKKIAIAVFKEEGFSYRLILIRPDVITSSGERRGDFWELVIEDRGVKFKAGTHDLPLVSSITELTASPSEVGFQG